MKCVTLLVSLLIGACAERAAFQPTENVSAVGHGGQPAAAYQIRDQPNGDPRVYVNVWSNGARESNDRTYVDMTMSVRNTGVQPVNIEPNQLVLEAYKNNGAPLPQGLLLAGYDAGSLRVDPGVARDVRLQFVMPARIRPNDIGSLRLRWVLDYDGGQQYVQFTEFQRIREDYDTTASVAFYDPIYGYYDPFFYPHVVRYRVPVGRVVIRDRPHFHHPNRIGRR